MKKNIAMRVAAFLFILTMISTCAFATTFAKYTTDGTATDTARVAKFGVEVTQVTAAANTLFVTQYQADDNTFSGMSVDAAADVVAPGTKGDLVEIEITGTPEVAVNVSYEASLELTGWQIGTDIYCPLIFKVGDSEIKWQSTIDNSIDTDANGKISTIDEFQKAVEAAIEEYSANYKAKQDLSAAEVITPAVSWSWAYSTSAENDVKDTELGDAAAAGNGPTISLTVTCTVTQID